MDKDFDLDEYEKGVKENKKYHKINSLFLLVFRFRFASIQKIHFIHFLIMANPPSECDHRL